MGMDHRSTTVDRPAIKPCPSRAESREKTHRSEFTMSTTSPDSSQSEEFDDGLLARLGDLDAYVAASPSPVNSTAFTDSSARSTDWSLSARLARASGGPEDADGCGQESAADC